MLEKQAKALLGQSLQEKFLTRTQGRRPIPQGVVSERTRRRLEKERRRAVLDSYGHGAVPHEVWVIRKDEEKRYEEAERKRRGSCGVDDLPAEHVHRYIPPMRYQNWDGSPLTPRVPGLNPPKTALPGHEQPRPRSSVEMLAAAKEAYQQAKPRKASKRRPEKISPLITKDGTVQHTTLRDAFLLGSPPGPCPAGVSHQWLANGEPIEVIVGEGVRYQQMFTCSSCSESRDVDAPAAPSQPATLPPNVTQEALARMAQVVAQPPKERGALLGSLSRQERQDIFHCMAPKDRAATLVAMDEDPALEALRDMTDIDRQATHEALIADLHSKGCFFSGPVVEALRKLKEILATEAATAASRRAGVTPESEGGPSEPLIQKLLEKNLSVIITLSPFDS